MVYDATLAIMSDRDASVVVKFNCDVAVAVIQDCDAAVAATVTGDRTLQQHIQLDPLTVCACYAMAARCKSSHPPFMASCRSYVKAKLQENCLSPVKPHHCDAGITGKVWVGQGVSMHSKLAVSRQPCRNTNSKDKQSSKLHAACQQVACICEWMFLHERSQHHNEQSWISWDGRKRNRMATGMPGDALHELPASARPPQQHM